jgi:hypothetical protein
MSAPDEDRVRLADLDPLEPSEVTPTWEASTADYLAALHSGRAGTAEAPKPPAEDAGSEVEPEQTDPALMSADDFHRHLQENRR